MTPAQRKENRAAEAVRVLEQFETLRTWRPRHFCTAEDVHEIFAEASRPPALPVSNSCHFRNIFRSEGDL
jgi:hypothetical protein